MPDLPERIVHQFEADSENARALQKRGQEADIAFDKRSQYMAYSLILVGMVGTFVLAYADKDVSALLTGASTLLLIFRGTFSKR